MGQTPTTGLPPKDGGHGNNNDNNKGEASQGQEVETGEALLSLTAPSAKPNTVAVSATSKNGDDANEEENNETGQPSKQPSKDATQADDQGDEQEPPADGDDNEGNDDKVKEEKPSTTQATHNGENLQKNENANEDAESEIQNQNLDPTLPKYGFNMSETKLPNDSINEDNKISSQAESNDKIEMETEKNVQQSPSDDAQEKAKTEGQTPYQAKQQANLEPQGEAQIEPSSPPKGENPIPMTGVEVNNENDNQNDSSTLKNQQHGKVQQNQQQPKQTKLTTPRAENKSTSGSNKTPNSVKRKQSSKSAGKTPPKRTKLSTADKRRKHTPKGNKRSRKNNDSDDDDNYVVLEDDGYDNSDDDDERPIEKICMTSNRVLTRYHNVQQAAGSVDESEEAITSALRNLRTSAGGFIWRYKGGYLPKENTPGTSVKPDNKGRVLQKLHKRSMKVLAEYPSVFDAARDCAASTADIYKALLGRNDSTSKYKWRYAPVGSLTTDNNNRLNDDDDGDDDDNSSDDNGAPRKGKRSPGAGRRAVLKLCKDTGNVLREFGSVAEAARSVEIKATSIRVALTNSIKTAGGYFWKYKDEYEQETSSPPLLSATKQQIFSPSSTSPAKNKRVRKDFDLVRKSQSSPKSVEKGAQWDQATMVQMQKRLKFQAAEQAKAQAILESRALEQVRLEVETHAKLLEAQTQTRLLLIQMRLQARKAKEKSPATNNNEAGAEPGNNDKQPNSSAEQPKNDDKPIALRALRTSKKTTKTSASSAVEDAKKIEEKLKIIGRVMTNLRENDYDAKELYEAKRQKLLLELADSL